MPKEVEIDHRAFIKSLSQEQRRELTSKSNWAGVGHLTFYLLALVITGLIIQSGLPLWQLALPIHGILIVFLFTLMHETIHRTVFENRWANDVVAWCCGIVLVLPPAWFRYFHFAHHRHTQDPENDPELESPKPETWVQYWRHVSGMPIWMAQIKALLINAFGNPDYNYVPEAGRGVIRTRSALDAGDLWRCRIAYRRSIMSGDTLIWLWIIPAILGTTILALLPVWPNMDAALL